jgi:1-deoxy-D-xylulose-5-phosphate synthase
MLALLRLGLSLDDGPFCIRWPRASVPEPVPALDSIPPIAPDSWEVLREGSRIAILAVGAVVAPSLEAASALAKRGISATVVNCRFLKPYDRELLADLLRKHDAVLTVEEGSRVNGFGAFLTREILDDPELRFPARFGTLGLPDRFIEHGSREVLLADVGLDPEGIAKRAAELIGVRSATGGGTLEAARESA